MNAHDIKQCTVCSAEFNEDDQPDIAGYFGIIPVAFCITCSACIYSLAEQLYGEKEE